MSKKILIVDDEKDIVELLEFNLETEGYKTITAFDGEEAIKKAITSTPDLILLDIMLPKKDGLEVLRELRTSAVTRNIPVIFLTAKGSEIDEVIGLELGADDYIIKPISIRKLLARIKKVFRKPTPAGEQTQPVLQFDDLIIDPEKYRVVAGSNEVVLTKKEFEILLYLARRPGRVVTRRIFLEELWDDNVVVIDRTIDVHVRKIREKLGEPYMNRIETIKGVGYRFRGE